MVINDAHRCEDTNHVHESSIIISDDFARLDKIEFETQLNELCYFF